MEWGAVASTRQVTAVKIRPREVARRVGRRARRRRVAPATDLGSHRVPVEVLASDRVRAGRGGGNRRSPGRARIEGRVASWLDRPVPFSQPKSAPLSQNAAVVHELDVGAAAGRALRRGPRPGLAVAAEEIAALLALLEVVPASDLLSAVGAVSFRHLGLPSAGPGDGGPVDARGVSSEPRMPGRRCNGGAARRPRGERPEGQTCRGSEPVACGGVGRVSGRAERALHRSDTEPRTTSSRESAARCVVRVHRRRGLRSTSTGSGGFEEGALWG